MEIKIKYVEYVKMTGKLRDWVEAQEKKGDEAKELELCCWYLEEIDDEVQNEAQLQEWIVKLNVVIDKMIRGKELYTIRSETYGRVLSTRASQPGLAERCGPRARTGAGRGPGRASRV